MIGRPEQIAVAAGCKEKAAYHWRRERTGRAAGDLPSAGVMRNLLAHASARNIPLTADHLIWGASASEVDALLARASSQPVAAE